MPDLSICIIAYNIEDYIDENLASVFAQKTKYSFENQLFPYKHAKLTSKKRHWNFGTCYIYGCRSKQTPLPLIFFRFRYTGNAPFVFALSCIQSTPTKMASKICINYPFCLSSMPVGKSLIFVSLMKPFIKVHAHSSS